MISDRSARELAGWNPCRWLWRMPACSPLQADLGCNVLLGQGKLCVQGLVHSSEPLHVS